MTPTERIGRGMRSALARALAGRAREFAARYDWSRVGPQLAELYRSVAGAA